MKGVKIILLLITSIITFSSVILGQKDLMDLSLIQCLDSLEKRIVFLERKIPHLKEIRDPDYYFARNDLDRTLFLKYYYNYLFDEDLDKAKSLIESKLKVAKKRRNDNDIDFYKEYEDKLKEEIINQQRRYQQLFAKEKNFKKEFNRFIDQNDEYSLMRAQRMTDLALKYARDKKLNSVTEYLYKYKAYASARIYDYHSQYDLQKLTSKESAFEKEFQPLVYSDSLPLIEEAGKLVRYCYDYAFSSSSLLDTAYFALKENVVSKAIHDYHARKGNSSALAGLIGQSVIASLDSFNREGIYQWNDNIIVIGHFKPDSKFDNVKKGEAILEADRTLIEYIRVNRLAKLGKTVRMGATFLIPYNDDVVPSAFLNNGEKVNYHFMVCYTRVENDHITREIRKLLPVMQFDYEVNGEM
ncbi:MAG: hypothetical protein JW894_10080 [Bacteroidales bacterium]|nr:hypothetical protein [Bacteroidales bacterium]